ncbi:hypothetical protein Clacol_001096 [Clathrus columnatus]|uniref:Uncharacterized protein n=1 Tax=Clathrus columnatus TaxID=1419009 RepID=A0AAV4ZYG2_9AGAM|nr:hypothetical protein Clacol_001096 [Clathrus columnatus]
MTRFNCQVWILVIYCSGYIGVGLSSALLTLRTIAFWNSNRIVVGVAISLYLLHISFLIYAMTQAHSIWDTATDACIELNTQHNLKNFLVTLSTDLALLAIMLSGIWDKRKEGGLWKLVYRQGILWVAGATFGQLPCVILTSLNYNVRFQKLPRSKA